MVREVAAAVKRVVRPVDRCLMICIIQLLFPCCSVFYTKIHAWLLITHLSNMKGFTEKTPEFRLRRRTFFSPYRLADIAGVELIK